MNRFRTKKKAKEAPEGQIRASTDSDGSSAPALKTSKSWGRKKNQEPEPQPEIDLTNALPSSDDFRTSLLMSGLSARFSMLREQDDPKSKIGKASDDSVLFPKRQSRLNDFGFQSNGLSDIAEVSSINGSIRPPFAFGRGDSYGPGDGYGTDDDLPQGSIMNRSKPGEGNNLFGGRQKIYKIPMNASGSSRSLTDGSGMGGRALYENDVSQSAFQKLREREREQERQERQEREEIEAQSSRPSSPPFSGYNRNRETSSTTSSGGPSITRSSTAATSFTSQRTPSLSGSHTPITPGVPVSGNSVVAKGRRLYETGLDQHLHEQQYSAMNRIDTLTRQRTVGANTPPPGVSPIIATHPSERWDRHQIAGKASMPNLRAASPTPAGTPLGTFDFGVRANNTSDTKPFGMTSPPLSPPMSEYDDHSILPVQPNDRGKATALGAFSKPAQPYDENKYSQRQLQMQQGRETPPLRKQSPPRAFMPRQHQQMGRTRAESNATFASARSSSNSSAQRHFLPPDYNYEPTKTQVSVPENEVIASGTFLSSPNGSSQGSRDEIIPEVSKSRLNTPAVDISRLYLQDQFIIRERPQDSQHPANRQQPSTAQDSYSALNGSPPSLITSNLKPNPIPTPPADSPTLGPTSGLSGMVRQHLRTDSNTSSVYGGVPSAELTSRFPLDTEEPMPQNEYTTKSNPWESGDWDQGYYGDNKFGQEEASNEVPAPRLSGRAPNIETHEVRKPSWEKEMEIHHTRDGSSETQKERQDFKTELANRRRQVQENMKENMKSYVETESRSVSPMPPVEWPQNGVLAKTNALGLLKPKSSRGSLVGRAKEGGQSKAMKMLGIGNATINSSPSPSRQDFERDAWKEEEEEMLRGIPMKPTSPPPQTKAFRQARRDAQRDRERQVAMRHQQQQQRAAAENSEPEWSNPRMENQQYRQEPQREAQREPSLDRIPQNMRTRIRTPSRERRGPPPVTHSYRTGSQESKDSAGSNHSGSRPASRTSRDRSGSDTSGGRSKSRNGRYKDDLAKAMAEGMSSSSRGAFEDLDVPSAHLMPKSPGTPGMAFQRPPVPSPMLNGNSGYFDAPKSATLQTGMEGMDIGLSPRPSPSAPFVVHATPPLMQPSPAGSGANTPTTQGFQSQGRIPTIRKRSINKSDISEPTFLSSTSRVTTVNLPPEASLRNGIDAPPIPPVNPRRRQTRGMFGVLMGRKDEFDDIHSMPLATQSTEEMSTFSADEGETKPKSRQKLRKSSSEGGNLNARARQATVTSPSPAMPGPFPASGSPPRPFEGGMF